MAASAQTPPATHGDPAPGRDPLPAPAAAAATHPAPPAGHTIDAEIFSVGVWNGERFERRDLLEIARNHRILRRLVQPPLKFGHDEGQTLLGQSDGDPALGWVVRVWVRGERLLARFAGLPTVVYDAIRSGRYRRVSAELYFGVRHERRRLGKVLKAVALLGADLPAVTNLADLTAYLATAGGTVPEALRTAVPGTAVPGSAGSRPGRAGAFDAAAAETRVFSLPAGREPSAPLAIPDPIPEITAMTDPSPTPDLQAELAELRAYKAQQEQRRQEEQQRRQADAFRSARGEALAFCDAQVRAGRLPPDLRERLARELDAQARTFAAGQPLRVSFDWVRHFLAQGGPVLPLDERAEERGGAAPLDGNPSVTLARLAADKMTELSLSYGEASAYVLRTQPGLARAYRDYTLNPNV